MKKISRVTRSKQKARQNYDRLSAWYDTFAKSEQKFTEKGMLAFDPHPGESLLEIGYGTGNALIDLARAAHPVPVHGIDLSFKMGQRAQSKFAQAGGITQARLTLGDAAQPPYPNNAFHGIFISFTLELFDTPEIPLVLAECKRVLKKGGRISVVALAKRESSAVRIYEWFHEKMPVLVDCRPIHAEASLQNAGFEITEKDEERMWGLPVSILVAKNV